MSQGKETRKCSRYSGMQISPRGWREGASITLQVKEIGSLDSAVGGREPLKVFEKGSE